MANTPEVPPTPAGLPPLDRDRLMTALGSPSRLKMLAVLCDGEPLAAADLAQIGGVTPRTGCMHGQVLVNAGICRQGRGNLYWLRKEFQPDPTKRILDFGYCVMRLDYPNPA